MAYTGTCQCALCTAIRARAKTIVDSLGPFRLEHSGNEADPADVVLRDGTRYRYRLSDRYGHLTLVEIVP